jgi:Holliday junction DNA helicase RuvB
MTREPLISGSQAREQDDVRLRPTRFEEIVGQQDVIEQVRIVMDAARKRKDVLGHFLFDGPPGLGKTTFATCIPREIGVPLEFLSGPALKSPKDLIPSLTNLQDHQVLFIDEIHRIPKAVEEYLYSAMEDFRIDLILGEGIHARTHSLPLRPFTLIGATTRAGMLSGPLRDRFQNRYHLTFYSTDELSEIVRRSAVKLGVETSAEAAREIAARSRSTPRVANSRLRWVRDFAQSRADGKIDLAVTREALLMAEIDELGLDRQDRKYLDTLVRICGGGPTGLETIAATMNTASDTLSDEIEPFLLRSELILRTPRGRMATPRAFELLGVPFASRADEPNLFS